VVFLPEKRWLVFPTNVDRSVRVQILSEIAPVDFSGKLSEDKKPEGKDRQNVPSPNLIVPVGMDRL
jgi:hypothetical protein